MSETSKALPDMVIPSTGSTLAFLLVVGFVYVAFVLGFRRAWQDSERASRTTLLAAALLGGWMLTTAVLAETGVVAWLAGSPKLLVYLACANALPIALAFSRAGTRLVQQLPIALLVGFQAFRLPLELVLHRWYEEGTLPVQMTYSGHNFDILSGILALAVGGVLHFLKPRESLERWLVLGFNLVGFTLLLTVVSIAVRSAPLPLRSYMNEPQVLLILHAPYTWILSVCVAGALLGHLLVFRWLKRAWTPR